MFFRARITDPEDPIQKESTLHLVVRTVAAWSDHDLTVPVLGAGYSDAVAVEYAGGTVSYAVTAGTLPGRRA